ncbi:MAG: chromophore lyase CpcT/CpeT [Planctomycetota bacterium]
MKRHLQMRLCVARTAMLLVVACSALSCKSAQKTDATVDEECRALVSAMTGWFDSSAQELADPDNYFNIRLVMTPVWTAREDGAWLYVEQAAASALDRPYRQRMYHVHRDASGQLRSDVYALPGEPLDYAGAYREPSRFDGMTPSDLAIREGCAILLDAVADGSFVGATVDAECTSSLRGATYATSEVTITADELMSWDRGWNDQHEQVWGATAGGYRFVKHGDGIPPAS